MKSSTIPLLACPAGTGSPSCGGMLVESPPAQLPTLASTRLPDELLEGGLRCLHCGTEFPILAGVAILAPQPEEYLRRYGRCILRDIDRHGTLTPAARAWLGRRTGREAEAADYGADFRFSQQFEEPWDVAMAVAEPPSYLYGGFAEWLRSLSGDGPYDILADWATELTREQNLLLDAGCGGGGLIARAGGRFQASFGIDFSFLAVLLARRAVLHRPDPERSYMLPVLRGASVERPLRIQTLSNAEFMVGDCRTVPFAADLFDAVCSSNVIDIVGIEAPLREAGRVLRRDGLLALSDPFYFRDGEAPPGDPRDAVQQVLTTGGFHIEQLRDGVPWAWATYNRHWRIYFNYCLAARKC